MLWRNPLPRYLALAALLMLAACGFSPIYGTHDNGHAVAADLNQVAIENIPDRQGQILKNALIDRMYGKGRPASPAYKLEITLRRTEEDLGIQNDATSTRSLLNMYADYKLQDMHDKVLAAGTTHSVASFNKLSQQYGTQSARDDAVQRTITELSNQIISRISLYFAEKSDKN